MVLKILKKYFLPSQGVPLSSYLHLDLGKPWTNFFASCFRLLLTSTQQRTKSTNSRLTTTSGTGQAGATRTKSRNSLTTRPRKSHHPATPTPSKETATPPLARKATMAAALTWSSASLLRPDRRPPTTPRATVEVQTPAPAVARTRTKTGLGRMPTRCKMARSEFYSYRKNDLVFKFLFIFAPLF